MSVVTFTGRGQVKSIVHRDAAGAIVHEEKAGIITATTPAAEPLHEPSLVELAVNFTGALSRWAKAGFPVVERDLFEARLKVCRACPHWDEAARLGAGKCKHPGCGCTRAKLWISTEKCPAAKWPA